MKHEVCKSASVHDVYVLLVGMALFQNMMAQLKNTNTSNKSVANILQH